MLSKSLISLFITFFCTQIWADAFLDSHLKEQMSTQGDAEIPVLLVFKSKPSTQYLKTYSDKIEFFQSSLLDHIEGLKQKMQWAKDKPLERLWIVNGVLVKLNAAQIQQVKKLKAVKGLYYSHRQLQLQKQEHELHLPQRQQYTYGLKKLNVEKLRELYPDFNGQGIRVGIIDTGLNPSHPDLKGKMIAYKDFSPNPTAKPGDGFNHGTHVAGTIAGGDQSGLAIGIAPEASLVIARIFGRNGSSSIANILKSMQWMADPDGDPSTKDFAQVVNNSWSDDEPYNDRMPEDEPFCHAITNWLQLGIIPVFSAGNSGPKDGTINLPGGCPAAFAVGATEHNDRSPHFSSTGPAVWRDIEINKPDVSAPGFKIISASADGGYKKMSGTSMAAPHVTGAFAILLQAYPNQEPTNLMRAMSAGVIDLGEPGRDKIFGEGRVDLLKSIQILTH
tara:strand:+ start:8498 stop:9838 length:1341 start_codon:yes stop_codon:yes gene_type:complete